jgi:hypothetical protein
MRRTTDPGSRIVAILGMHRSGTSWLTGSLQHLGLELGEVNTEAQHNRKGNRENDFVRELHGEVLRHNGGSWRAPAWPNEWPRSARRRLSKFIRGMSAKHDLWGFKDPRTLMVLDEWHRQVDGLVRVGIYRHPLAVYRSLNKRHDDFTEEEAVGLWRTYNVRLIEEHRRDPFPVMRFDVDERTRSANLTSIATSLELDTSKDPEAFFDKQLVHNDPADTEPIPSDVADVWRTLQDISSGSQS